MTFDGLDFDPALACDLAEVAAERDAYATEATALRRQLAAAIATATAQANMIGDLRALLDGAGIAYRNRIGERTALALIGA
ncbi:MAG: hypothetical protein ACRDVE_02960 [Actinocrinis sp.]